jgi:hypothetical protein
MNIIKEWLEIRKHNSAIKRRYGKSPVQPGDITARNYMEAIEKARRDGFTADGDVYKTITHVGHNRWRPGVEKFK